MRKDESRTGGEGPELEERIDEALAARAQGGQAALEHWLNEHPSVAEPVREHLSRLDALGLLDERPEAARSRAQDRLGGFRLLERLGEGGMGLVWIAEETALGRRVALKMIRPEHLWFEGARERFRREVEAVARLQHPGIVPVHAASDTRGSGPSNAGDPEGRLPRLVEGHGMLAGRRQRRVLFDERSDALWALADAYKAGFDRGALVECYDLGLEAPEQSFLVPERLGPGALVIELEVESERVAAPTPLVDPVISTFDVVPPIVLDRHSPDAVYDEATGWWCLTFERAFSASDNDVFSLRLEADGSELWDSVIDATTTSWSTPRIANNRGESQILIVASVGPDGSRDILGRTQAAFIPSTSGVITISPGGADDVNPDVGGDGSLETSTQYCVVWQRILNQSNHDVMRQTVRTNGLLLGSTSMLSSPSSTIESFPSISSSNGDGGSSQRFWTVAWHRFALFDSDLYAARLDLSGGVVNSAFALDTTVNDTRFPSVSSPAKDGDRRVLVADMRGSAGSTKIHAYLLEGGTTVLGANLSTLTGAPSGENHVYPSIDCDGSDFVLAHTRSFPSSSLYGVYLSTISSLPDRLAAAETQLPVGASGPTLFGSLYDASPFTTYCEPGRDGVMGCPCGNAPSETRRGCDNSSLTGGARLTASGSVQPDTVTITASDMKPNALCLLAQSSLYHVSSAFGDGVLCITGPVHRMGVKAASAGQASWPGPVEPSLTARSAALGDTIQSGSARHYFVYYRDPDGSFACGPTFNATQALQVRW